MLTEEAVEMPNEFIEVCVKDVGAYAYCLYMYLLSYCDINTLECSRSITNVAKEMGISRTQIIRSTKKLVNAGWISVCRDNSQNVYKCKQPEEILEAKTGIPMV